MNDAAEHGTMNRDERDVWPEDVPVGTFDIEASTFEGYPGATAHIAFVCPNGRRCGVLLGPNEVAPTGDQRLHIWAWNGDFNRPSLNPSLNCLAEKDGKPTSGCGWHGWITNGVIR